MNSSRSPVEPHWRETIAAAAAGHPLTPAGIAALLALEDPEGLEALLAAARRVRRQHFGREVFLYGFLYVSTYCRNSCNFCLYRRQNRLAPRYRKSPDEIVALACGLARSGVHLIDLTLGEDPLLYDAGAAGFDDLLATIEEVLALTGLPVMLSAGVAPPPVLERFAAIGGAWYACYQETHSPALYRRLRSGQDYDRRMESKLHARRLGLLVEEGLLVDVGETPADIAHSMDWMARMAADQVRAMTFVPQPGTPLGERLPGDDLRERKTIALLRLTLPDRLIPASLDVDGLAGLQRRLEAGANVVTSLVPPGEGLAGVAQSTRDIDGGRRTVAGIDAVLADCGLVPATAQRYRDWIRQRREARSPNGGRER